MINYRGKCFKKYIIKEAWLEEAIETAKARRNFHSDFGSMNHWHDPKKGEYADEIFGSLGQIAFHNQIKENGLDKFSEFVPLYTNDLSTLPEWDAKVCGVTIEIKTIPPDEPNIKRCRMLVKVSEFKKLDQYAAVKFWDDKTYSFCGFATGNEISNSPISNFGFAKAYWRFINELPHKYKNF
jgi:hypothetical protein